MGDDQRDPNEGDAGKAADDAKSPKLPEEIEELVLGRDGAEEMPPEPAPPPEYHGDFPKLPKFKNKTPDRSLPEFEDEPPDRSPRRSRRRSRRRRKRGTPDTPWTPRRSTTTTTSRGRGPLVVPPDAPEVTETIVGSDAMPPRRTIPLGAWLGGLGLLIVIVILAILALSSGGGEEGPSPAAPIDDPPAAAPGDPVPSPAQSAATQPPATAPPQTEPPVTDPPATEPPSTTQQPPTDPDDPPPASDGPLAAPPFDVSELPVISAVTDPTDDVLPCNSQQVVEGPRPAADLTALVTRDGGDMFIFEISSLMSFLEAFSSDDSVARLFSAALSGDVVVYVIAENHLGVQRIGPYDPFTDQMLDDDGTMVWGTAEALVIGIPKQDRDLVEVLVLSFNTPDVNAAANGNSCDNIVATFGG